MARINAADELIITVPEVNNDTHAFSRDALLAINKRIDTAINKSFHHIPPSDRYEHIKAFKLRHRIIRHGGHAYEYAVRVLSYGDRHRAANNELTPSDLERLWKDEGLGLDVELCGYSSTHTVLVPLKFFHSVEIYRRANFFTREDITFPRSGPINERLLTELHAAEGCTTTTIEVMYKYYQQLSRRKQNRVYDLKAAAEKTNSSSEMNDDPDDINFNDVFKSKMSQELHRDQLKKICCRRG